MNQQTAIDILAKQQVVANTLVTLDRDHPSFKKWRRDTQIAIQRIFGEESRHIRDFNAVRYSLGVYTTRTTDREIMDAFQRGIYSASAILESLKDEIELYGLKTPELAAPEASGLLLQNICLRFHAMVRQLGHRYAERPIVRVNDEYDVQYLLHAVLRLHFDDIRPEEWTPSYAGGASRFDFLLKKEKIVIEVKKTRSSLNARELGEQLIVDRAKYRSHPDCSTLFCFVYDPDGLVQNPVGIERDLEHQSDDLTTRVIIAPRI